MLEFILGFIIGSVTELIVLKAQKRRNNALMINGNGNNVKYEHAGKRED